MGILSKLGVIWNEWNLQSFVISSFTLQLILILAAPFRKQSANSLIIFLVWVSYLLADWIAIQAIGFVIKRLNDDPRDDLLAFWAQFLLLHLGGPDTITALALEDNELWLRTALQLGAQIYSTLGVLVKDIGKNRLWAPTIMIFFAGCIKYTERVLSLLYGRLTYCDEEPGHYAKLLEAYEPKDWNIGIPLSSGDAIKQAGNNQKDVEVVRHAFYFFHYYKGLYADRIFRFPNWQASTSYFLRRTSEEAFKVLEIELNLAYDTFYTKMIIIHKKFGMYVRPVVMVLEVASLVVWTFFTNKNGFHDYDVRITNTLLMGAVAVDVLGVLRIQFSYWNIAHIREDSRFGNWIYNKLLSASKRNWGSYWIKEEAPMGPWFRRALFRRWSETVSQFNLIDLSVNKWSKSTEKVIDYIGIKDPLDGMFYVRKKWFANYIRDIIFMELRPTLELDGKPGFFEDFSTGKDWGMWYQNLGSRGFKFPVLVEDMEFDEIMLIWHIATEICYNLPAMGMRKPDGEKNLMKRAFGRLKGVFTSIWTAHKGEDEEENERKIPNIAVYREFSKVISDYMSYLLVRQPNMLSTVAGSSKMRFRDTCAHVDKVLERRELWEHSDSKNKAERHQKTCEYLVDRHHKISANGSESVLIKAVHLAAKLQKLEKNKEVQTWELIARQWVAILLYAAKHCKPNVHAAQLRHGGEMLSFVWLLSVHFGLGQPFQ